MAEISNNDNTSPVQVPPAPKVYATDEAGMMKDAKAYAKQDFRSVVDTMRKLNCEEEQFPEEAIAKALILVKYAQIKESRLNRNTYFD